ncbi:MAG: CehA/McbA family metallohydrolase [Terriglobia bacterium]
MRSAAGCALLLVAFSCWTFAQKADTSQPPPILSDAGRYAASRHGGAYMWNYYIPPAPATTPWAPCWSPDGKRIAVAMQGSIWVVDPQTGEAAETTKTSGYASSPTWSPDGNWIVYTDDYDHRRIQLEAVEVSSGDSHALTDDSAIYLDPVFSPDGMQLAYVSTLPNGYFNIYVRAIHDGRWSGEPVAVTTDAAYARDRLYFGQWDMHTQPAWTPDGKELVFVWNHDNALGSGDLWRAPAIAGGMSQAKRILHEQTLYRTRPHVSPDGKRIVYASTAGAADEFNNLYLLPIGGGDPYKITFGAYDHFHPRWSPDGEWIAFISNQEGLPQLCLLETWGGALKKVRITARAWKRPMGRLHGRVIDAATGLPTAARVQGTGADGRAYAPADTYARASSSGAAYFHTTGEFTVELPPGRMTLEVIKGFEYEPVKQQLQIVAGRTTSATFSLRRIADLPAQGWYSGSTHVHMNYGGNFHDTPENLAQMASAEDLHMVNAMASNKDNRVIDWQYFRPDRQDYPLQKAVPGVRIMFGEEYRPAFWGHTFLLGMRDHLVSPFTANYEGTAIDSLYPTNTDVFRKVKAQGGVTGYVHPFGDSDPVESGYGAKGFPVDAALGALDALEWSGAVRAEMGVWHRLLNNDIALVPTGGEDSENDLHALRTLGAIRTFAHLDGPLSGDAWLEALSRGRTFFSTSPLLDLKVEGKLPGSTLRLPAGGGTVLIEASLKSVVPVSKVVLYHRRGVLREIPVNSDGKSAHFREPVRLAESDWISLAAEGPPDSRFEAAFALAITNAVRIYAGNEKIRDRASAEYYVRWVEKIRAQAEKWPWWSSEAEKKHVLAQFDEAQQVYRQLIKESEEH